MESVETENGGLANIFKSCEATADRAWIHSGNSVAVVIIAAAQQVFFCLQYLGVLHVV